MKKYDTTKLLHQYIQANKDKFDIKVNESYYSSMFAKRHIWRNLWARLTPKSHSIEVVICYKETGKIAYKLILGEWGKTLDEIIKDIRCKKRMKYIAHRMAYRKQNGYNGM